MSFLLTNLSMFNKFAVELIRARKFQYSEESLPVYVNSQIFRNQYITDIKNLSGFILSSMLITHKYPKIKTQEKQQNIYQSFNVNKKICYDIKCIIYMHGLGSSKLEALSIVEYLPKQYCLFAFDFAGCGKSQGESITYGLREAQDIDCIIDYLGNNRGIKQFVLWGRSMGAVAALLYAKQLAESSKASITAKQKLRKMKGLVLDSPFCNFQQIAKQIGLKKIKIPQFILNFGLGFINNSLTQISKDNNRENKIYNPFQIKLGEQPIDTKIPTIFLYSIIDEVVPKQHSQKLIKCYKSPFYKIIMQLCSHNQPRPKQIIIKIFQNLYRFQAKFNYQISNQDYQHFGKICGRNKSLELYQKGNRGNRRGISVQSKQKQRKIITIESVLTEQSQISNKNNPYNMRQKVKIIPKISCKLTEAQQKNNQILFSGKNTKTVNCSPMRVRLSDNVNITNQNKVSVDKFRKLQQFKQSVNSFYCALDLDHNVLQKKLKKDKIQQSDGQKLSATKLLIRKTMSNIQDTAK